ncbi:hypothetical protein KIPB_006391 [Kipferlia bialata]|uniref:Uncharacterized protein n=1 Tax=Kipferlia bialata TaxID=797122 RepID=A0A9K3GJT3_9EUKA|nr:hypothetical protein KIPB_006391 [Kipferlia bialata]|eukprot:g6391.t1
MSPRTAGEKARADKFAGKVRQAESTLRLKEHALAQTQADLVGIRKKRANACVDADRIDREVQRTEEVHMGVVRELDSMTVKCRQERDAINILRQDVVETERAIVQQKSQRSIAINTRNTIVSQTEEQRRIAAGLEEELLNLQNMALRETREAQRCEQESLRFQRETEGIAVELKSVGAILTDRDT